LWGPFGGGVIADGPRGPLDRSLSFVCADVDNLEGTCFTGPRTAAHRRHPREVPSPGLVALSCNSWIGTGVAAAICDPRTLRRAVKLGRLAGAPTHRIAVAGRHGRSVSAAGIVQLAGQPFANGARIKLSRSVGRGATLMLELHGRGKARHHIYIARFANLAAKLRTSRHARSAGASLRIQVGSERARRASVSLGGVRASSVRVLR